MKKQFSILLKLCIEVDATKKFVKIKAHKRIVNDKIVKVRSHYQRIWGA